MKIAYILQQTGVDPRTNGVVKKVYHTAKQWRSLGHDVRIFFLGSVPKNTVREAFPEIEFETFIESASANKLVRFRLFSELVHAVSTFKPDAVYMRFGIFYPSFLTLMKELPTFVEVNGDDAEMKYFGRLTRYYHKYTRGFWFRKASGFIYVTGELATFPHLRFAGETRIIPNGINLNLFPSPPSSPNPPTQKTHLVFVGTGTIWHGIDQIVSFAKIKPDWNFDLIGPLDIANPPPNVTLHGQLEKSDYLTILTQADFAIGTMAMYRAGIHEACTLKVREYLACGLPTIIGHKDADFTQSDDFILSLPNKENALVDNLDLVEAFVRNWKGKKVPRERISHLSSDVKELARLDFIDQVVTTKRRSQSRSQH